MLSAYLPIGILMLVAIVVAGALLFLSSQLGPRRPNPEKQMPYESGVAPIGPARRRFPVKFSLVAMLFIIFDIEVVFFYPWAVTFRALKIFGLVEMLLFIGILLVGYVYVIKKGALEWE